jgi:lipopolysaccharide export system protein LptA
LEKTISQLFEIELKANQIVNRAVEEKAKLHDEYEKEIVQMEADIFSENSRKLKALQEQADIDLANETKVLIQNSEKHLNDLEEIKTNKYESLVNQVFDRIVHS